MKKHILFVIAMFTVILRSQAQATDDHSAIKLFIDPGTLESTNPDLTGNLQDRLYQKIVQLINQTGVAEIGYSTFLVSPVFDVLSTSVDQAGIAKVWLAECELSLSIYSREFGKAGAASYASFVKKITGSGASKEEAIANGINSISPADNEITDFLKRSKSKIDAYFKAHCEDVITEASQAFKLKEYGKSIALYFSIPSSAPCYDKARSTSIGVYMKYVEDDCEKQLIKLKAITTLAITNDTARSASRYDEALRIIINMDPASAKCYAEARKEIEKIEKRFDENQKREWELESKKSSNTAELQKEMVKAMGKISSNYHPQPAGGTIIISK